MRKLQNGKEVKTWAISCQECLTEQQLRSRERESGRRLSDACFCLWRDVVVVFVGLEVYET